MLEETVRETGTPVLQMAREAVAVVEELSVVQSLASFEDMFLQGYDACDDDYVWWRQMSPSLRALCLSGRGAACVQGGGAGGIGIEREGEGGKREEGGVGENGLWWNFARSPPGYLGLGSSPI